MTEPDRPDVAPIPPGDPARAAIVPLFARAFARDTLIDWLLPVRGDRDAARVRLFQQLLTDMGGRLHATADRQAAALWFAPDDASSWWVQAQFFRLLVTTLGGLNGTSRGLGLKRLQRQRPAASCYYLQLLATAPESRGRGRGRALASAMLERARLDDAPACLETASQANVRFYQGLGFQVSAELHLAGGLTVWSMAWFPGQARIEGAPASRRAMPAGLRG